jgi:hypothetical protein
VNELDLAAVLRQGEPGAVAPAVLRQHQREVLVVAAGLALRREPAVVRDEVLATGVGATRRVGDLGFVEGVEPLTMQLGRRGAKASRLLHFLVDRKIDERMQAQRGSPPGADDTGDDSRGATKPRHPTEMAP